MPSKRSLSLQEHVCLDHQSPLSRRQCNTKGLWNTRIHFLGLYHLTSQQGSHWGEVHPPVLDSKAIRVPSWPILLCLPQDLGPRPRMLDVSVSQTHGTWFLPVYPATFGLHSLFSVLQPSGCLALSALGHRITCLLFLQSQGRILCPAQSDVFLGPHCPGALSLLSPATLIFCLALSTARKMLLFTEISHGVRSILIKVCP